LFLSLTIQVKPTIGTAATVSITYEQARLLGTLDPPQDVMNGLKMQQQHPSSAAASTMVNDNSKFGVFGESEAGCVFQDQENFAPVANGNGVNLNSNAVGSPSKKLKLALNNFQPMAPNKQEDANGETKPQLLLPKTLQSPLKLPLLSPQLNTNSSAISDSSNSNLQQSNNSEMSNNNELRTNPIISPNQRATPLAPLTKLQPLQAPVNSATVSATSVSTSQQPLQQQPRFVRVSPDDQKMDVETPKVDSNSTNANKWTPVLNAPPPSTSSATSNITLNSMPNNINASILLPPTGNSNPTLNNSNTANATITMNPHVPPRKIVTAPRSSPPNGALLVPKIAAGPT
jgi:hypothetical protein